jgi:putative inorganic carbon (HCO3(-)) transporter
VRALCGRVVQLEPLILLLLTPLVLLRPTIGSILLVAVPMIWLCRRLVTGHLFERTAMDWSILALSSMALVSLGVTPAPDLTHPRVLIIVLGISVFYAVESHTRDNRGLMLAVASYLMLGALVAIAGIVGTNWLFKFPFLRTFLNQIPRVLDSLPDAELGFHPNEVAGTLVWFVPLQVACLAFQPKEYWDSNINKKLFRGLLLGSTLLTIGTLVLTQSRGGWFGVILALLVMMSMADRRGILVVGGLTLALILVVLSVGPSRFMETLARWQTQTGVKELSLSFRLEMWKTALQGIDDFFFTGMGLGAFRRIAPLLYPMNIDPGYPFGHAHNHLLHTGVEMGTPGLIAYLALWLLAAWLVIDTSQHAREWHRVLAIGFAGALSAYFAYGITDTVALGAKPSVVFWFILGMIVALHRITTVNNQTP